MEAHNVFVYGSLLADDVVRVLLKRVPQSSPAVLHDFQRFSIKGRIYPAILPVDKKSIAGKVLMGITATELDILDMFEDVEYERRDVEVALVESSEKLKAAAYVWCNSSDPDLYGEWDFEALRRGSCSLFVSDVSSFAISTANLKKWKTNHIEEFMKMTVGFVKELELPKD